MARKKREKVQKIVIYIMLFAIVSSFIAGIIFM